MLDNHNPPWSSMKQEPQETGGSDEENVAIPCHLHSASMDFDSAHSRAHSTSLQSPFDTPDLGLDGGMEHNSAMMFPEFSQTNQVVYKPRKKLLGMQPTRGIDTLTAKPPPELLGDPGPIAPSSILNTSNQFSTGLTPLLQSSPFFPPNSFGSQRSTVKQEQNEFPPPTTESPNKSEPIVFESSTENEIHPKGTAMGDFKRLSLRVDETNTEPPTKRRSLATGITPIISSQLETYDGEDDSLFDMPVYDSPMMATPWAREDEEEIMKLFEEAEKVKWNYMSDQLFAGIGKRVPPSACHRKFLDLFGVSENTTILGSSLNYIAYRDGWKVIRGDEDQ